MMDNLEEASNVEETDEFTEQGNKVIEMVKNLPDDPIELLIVFCTIYANIDNLHPDLTEVALFSLFLRAQEYLQRREANRNVPRDESGGLQ